MSKTATVTGSGDNDGRAQRRWVRVSLRTASVWQKITILFLIWWIGVGGIGGLVVGAVDGNAATAVRGAGLLVLGGVPLFALWYSGRRHSIRKDEARSGAEH
jgi:hypothetical protein